MTTTITALTARTQFGQLMRRAKTLQNRFLVSKKGELQVVIMGVEDYFNNILKEPKSLKKAQNEAKKFGLDTISLTDIDAEISKTRKKLWSQKSK